MMILSLFPGIDLLGRAFEQEWPEACIVRGPDVLWGGDIKRFHVPAGVFDGIIGGPPCQCFSRLRHIVKQRWGESAIAENLIPEFERVVSEAQPEWFLMENVPEAPVAVVPGYIVRPLIFNNRWAAEAPEQNRLRQFSFGSKEGAVLLPETCLLENPKWSNAVLASGGNPVINDGYKRRSDKMRHLGRKTTAYLAEAIRLQGLPADFLADAPFTVEGKVRVIGNGVPLPMGRAIARAVRRAMEATS